MRSSGLFSDYWMMAGPVMTSSEVAHVGVWFAAHLRGALLRFARSQVGDADQAKAVTRTILLRIPQRLPILRQSHRAETGIVTIARATVNDHLRRADPTAAFEEGLGIYYRSQEAAILEAAIEAGVRRLIQSFPPMHQEAIQSIDYRGVAHTAFAVRRNLSLSGAKSRVQRARVTLRAVIVESCQRAAADLGPPPAKAGCQLDSRANLASAD